MVWIALIVVGNLISLIIGKSCIPDYNFLHKPSEVFNSFVKQLHAYSGLIANDRIVKVYERGILKSLAGIRKNINPAAPHRLQWHPCPLRDITRVQPRPLIPISHRRAVFTAYHELNRRLGL